MSLNIKGTLLEIMDLQQITESFKKREFVIECAENPQYTEFIKFELIQDKCALLDNYKIGDTLNIHFNLKGRKWTDKEGQIKYFNSLNAWRLEIEETSKTSSSPDATPPLGESSEPNWSSNEKEDDDLPF